MIMTKESFCKEELKQQEGAYTIGNGYMHIRGSLDFDLPFAPQNDTFWRLPANVTIEEAAHPYSKWGVYIPGIVGKHPLLNEEMVNLPYLCGISLSINGMAYSFSEETITEFKQIFHMDTSSYEYEFTIQHESGDIHLHVTRCCDWNDPHAMIQNITIKADPSIRLKVSCFIDMDVTTNGYHHLIHRQSNVHDNTMEVMVTTDLHNVVAIAQQLHTNARVVGNIQKEQRIAIIVEGNRELNIERVSSVWTSLDDEHPDIIARKHLNTIATYPYSLDAHLNLLQKQWKLHRVVIEGDDQAQLAMDFSLYHLMRSKSIYDTVAIDAKGAAGEAYFGHYFWDTEIYLLPFFLYTEPKKAKDLLMFRVHTLHSAMENAKAYGYQGAKYPWESSISGKEQCPNWQYKDHEIHVSFDIVYAMQEYYAITQDEETCKTSFFPVVEQVAKFALSRCYQDVDGSVHYHGVMGPDEYIMFCHDNYYTNYMAAYSMQVYLDWCHAFDKPCEDKRYQYVIEHIHLPQKKDIFQQCEDFDTFEDIDFDKVWKDRSKPFGAQISQEHNYRCKALKQADTLALFYLFDGFDQTKLKANMDYYLPITTHDSSLSYVIHAILFTRIHEIDKAYAMFEKACAIDFSNMGASEGIHIANAGGLWQAVIFGFAGLQNLMWHRDISVKPKLPKHWKSIQFQLVIKEQVYEIKVTKEQVHITRKEHSYA